MNCLQNSIGINNCCHAFTCMAYTMILNFKVKNRFKIFVYINHLSWRFTNIVVTARQRSCGKVMFSQVSVNLFTGVNISHPMSFPGVGISGPRSLQEVGVSLVPGPFYRGVCPERLAMSKGMGTSGELSISRCGYPPTPLTDT